MELREPLDDDPPLPEYITGDECLFCHRFETGQKWQANRHNRTIRAAMFEPATMAQLKTAELVGESAAAVDFVMGNTRRVRFLKKGKSYGRLDLLSVELVPPSADGAAKLLHAEEPIWDSVKFGEQCAGCHATQLNSRTKSFSAASLDCYVCHGAATLDHANDTTRMLLAKARRDPSRVIVSICGQCHLRGGRSKSSALPFPNNFVAGGNLFRDFVVDYSLADDAKLNPGDRHIYQNARDVIERDETGVTCLSCHSVHGGSTVSHRRLAASALCLNCHNATGPKSARKPYEVHSSACGY